MLSNNNRKADNNNESLDIIRFNKVILTILKNPAAKTPDLLKSISAKLGDYLGHLEANRSYKGVSILIEQLNILVRVFHLHPGFKEENIDVEFIEALRNDIATGGTKIKSAGKKKLVRELSDQKDINSDNKGNAPKKYDRGGGADYTKKIEIEFVDAKNDFSAKCFEVAYFKFGKLSKSLETFTQRTPYEQEILDSCYNHCAKICFEGASSYYAHFDGLPDSTLVAKGTNLVERGMALQRKKSTFSFNDLDYARGIMLRAQYSFAGNLYGKAMLESVHSLTLFSNLLSMQNNNSNIAELIDNIQKMYTETVKYIESLCDQRQISSREALQYILNEINAIPSTENAGHELNVIRAKSSLIFICALIELEERCYESKTYVSNEAIRDAAIAIEEAVELMYSVPHLTIADLMWLMKMHHILLRFSASRLGNQNYEVKALLQILTCIEKLLEFSKRYNNKYDALIDFSSGFDIKIGRYIDTHDDRLSLNSSLNSHETLNQLIIAFGNKSLVHQRELLKLLNGWFRNNAYSMPYALQSYLAFPDLLAESDCNVELISPRAKDIECYALTEIDVKKIDPRLLFKLIFNVEPVEEDKPADDNEPRYLNRGVMDINSSIRYAIMFYLIYYSKITTLKEPDVTNYIIIMQASLRTYIENNDNLFKKTAAENSFLNLDYFDNVKSFFNPILTLQDNVAEHLEAVRRQIHELIQYPVQEGYLYNLAGITLRDIDLSNCELFFCDFTRAKIQGDLTGALIFQSTLDGADFNGANLQNAQLLRCSAIKTSFQGADLSGAFLQGNIFDKTSFVNAKFQDNTRTDTTDIDKTRFYCACKHCVASFENNQINDCEFDDHVYTAHQSLHMTFNLLFTPAALTDMARFKKALDRLSEYIHARHVGFESLVKEKFFIMLLEHLEHSEISPELKLEIMLLTKTSDLYKDYFSSPFFEFFTSNPQKELTDRFRALEVLFRVEFEAKEGNLPRLC